MKKLIIILFYLISISLNATTYYVAPTTATPAGNDVNAGTSDAPWATWLKGFQTAVAGDTVFIRGGVYYKPNATSYNVSNNGTAENHIVFANYPGEIPILDCGNYRPTTYNEVIYTSNKSYIDFIGLTVRNVLQPGGDYGTDIKGFYFYMGTEVRAIRCTAYNISGIGFMSAFNNNDGVHYFINCDAYNVIDTLSAPGYVAGRGTGFRSYTFSGTSLGTTYFQSCRAWNCSDQGFSLSYDAVTIADGCWSFNNGYEAVGSKGDGHGFKMGWANVASEVIKRRVTNCIAAYNDYSGFTTNDQNYTAVRMGIYNNIAYENGNGRFTVAYGFIILNPSDDDDELLRIFKNNISYANQSGPVVMAAGALYTHDHNSWDIPLSFTDADFVSVDSTGITAPRQADGSLPDNDCYKYFLRPSSTFQGYQQGTDVGLTYDAVDSLWLAPPSIGFKEYYPITPAVEPTLADVATYKPRWITTTTATTGGYIGDDGGADITARGVCWNTTGDPTTANSKTEDGTGDGAFTSTMTDLTYGTVYYVKAYGTNSAGTSYGSEMTFRTSIIKHDNKVIKHNGKVMVID